MTVIIVQKLGSEFPRRPAFLGNELRLPPIWGVLELDLGYQGVAAAYHRVCKKVKEATGRDVK